MAVEFNKLKNGVTLEQNNRYFSLESKASFDVWGFIKKIPYSLPVWFFSFFFARLITILALNPSDTKKQRTTHLVNLSNSKEHPDEIIVVNVLPQERFKVLKDYLLKFNNAVFPLPFMDSIKKRQLSFDNSNDRKHIDNVLEQIEALLKGTSSDDKCKNRIFTADQLYFKGLESLSDGLSRYFTTRLHRLKIEIRNRKPKVNLEFFTLKNTEGSVLDSVEVSMGDECDKFMHERKFIISCLPRQQNYINYIKDSRLSAQKIGATIIGFNYRGVDYSKGMVWTHTNMVDDVIAQVQRLLARGVPAKNIGLEGTSLGGAVATVASARLHDLGYAVKLYSERSFRDIPRFVSGHILPEAHESLKNPLNFLKLIAGSFVFICITVGVWCTDWMVDAATAWKKIPPEDKCYSVIRKAGDPSTGQAPVVDGIVHNTWTSIASLIDEQRIDAKKKQELGEELTADENAIVEEKNPELNYFVPKSGEQEFESEAAAALAKRYANNPAHFYARHRLVRYDDTTTMHDHMVEKFTGFFNAP